MIRQILFLMVLAIPAHSMTDISSSTSTQQNIQTVRGTGTITGLRQDNQHIRIDGRQYSLQGSRVNNRLKEGYRVKFIAEIGSDQQPRRIVQIWRSTRQN